GVQGHGEQRDLPVARARRAPHLPGDRPGEERHAQGGEALSARDRAQAPPAAARARGAPSSGGHDQAARAPHQVEEQRGDLRPAEGLAAPDAGAARAASAERRVDFAPAAPRRASIWAARASAACVLAAAALASATLIRIVRAERGLPLWDEAAQGFAGL